MNELLPQMPGSSLYQPHLDDANESSLQVVVREDATSSIFLCETTFNHEVLKTNQGREPVTLRATTLSLSLKVFYLLFYL